MNKEEKLTEDDLFKSSYGVKGECLHYDESFRRTCRSVLSISIIGMSMEKRNSPDKRKSTEESKFQRRNLLDS